MNTGHGEIRLGDGSVFSGIVRNPRHQQARMRMGTIAMEGQSSDMGGPQSGERPDGRSASAHGTLASLKRRLLAVGLHAQELRHQTHCPVGHGELGREKNRQVGNAGRGLGFIAEL